MEIEIWTSDPLAVDPVEVRQLLEKAGYYVGSVVVHDRGQ